MPKPNTIAWLFCILFSAFGAQSAHANEREYLSCIGEALGDYRPVERYILDEERGTVSREYSAPYPAVFDDDTVSWGKAPQSSKLNRKTLSLTFFFMGFPQEMQCKKILPYEVGERQKWSIRALSLNCDASGSGEGDSPTIELKGQMRLDVSHPRTKSRIVFNVTSKKGYRRIFCDGRNHTATDATPFVLEGNPNELAGGLWRVRTNFDEIDFGSPIRGLREYKQGGLAQAHWPDKISQLTSGWKVLPHENRLNSKGALVIKYAIPKRKGQPDLHLRIEFKRVE